MLNIPPGFPSSTFSSSFTPLVINEVSSLTFFFNTESKNLKSNKKQPIWLYQQKTAKHKKWIFFTKICEYDTTQHMLLNTLFIFLWCFSRLVNKHFGSKNQNIYSILRSIFNFINMRDEGGGVWLTCTPHLDIF